MRKFDLEAAKQGKKVVTRDGKCFVYGGYNPNATERERVLGWIDGKSISFGEDGKEVRSIETANDLFMAMEKKTVWIAVSNEQFGTNRLATNACDSKEELLKSFAYGTVMSGQHQIVSFEIEV